jgi:hypothetical protein
MENVNGSIPCRYQFEQGLYQIDKLPLSPRLFFVYFGQVVAPDCGIIYALDFTT